MNVEFTDKAFTYNNRDVKRNLNKVMAFKDEVRTFMNTVLFEEKGYCQILFKILGKQFSLPANLLENLTQQELLDLYKNHYPEKKKVLLRQSAYVSIWNKNFPIEGHEAKFIIKKFASKAPVSDAVKG